MKSMQAITAKRAVSTFFAASMMALLASSSVQAQGVGFTAQLDGYANPFCETVPAADGSYTELLCRTKKGKLVGHYRQTANGRLTILQEEGKIGIVLTKWIKKTLGLS